MKSLFIIIFIFNVSYNCTIGAAYDHDGRPFLFKVRDRDDEDNNKLYYNTSGQYKYVGIINTSTNNANGRTWGGLNEHGFAIVNAVTTSDDDIDQSENGEFMHNVLSNCSSYSDFSELYSNNNNLIDANFIILSSDSSDSSNKLRFFEKNIYDEFELINLESSGCRSNFLYKELSDLTDLDEYDTDISDSTYATPEKSVYRQQFCEHRLEGMAPNEINEINILNNVIRKFIKSDFPGLLNSNGTISNDFSEYDVPYEYQVLSDGSPNGYIDTKFSISRDENVSLILIRGVIGDEETKLTTLWNTIGTPTFGVLTPIWVVGEPPLSLSGQNHETQAPIEIISNLIKKRLYSWEEVDSNGIGEQNYIDSFQLIHPTNIDLWNNFTMIYEQDIFDDVMVKLNNWNSLTTDEVIKSYQDSIATFIYNAFHSLDTNKPVVECDFEYKYSKDKFMDRSLHNPTGWEWSINDTTIIDQRNPEYTFSYCLNSIALRVTDDDGNALICSNEILCLIGDVDRNNQQNISDIILIVNFILGVNYLEYDQQIIADINDDDSIDVLDITNLIEIILE